MQTKALRFNRKFFGSLSAGALLVEYVILPVLAGVMVLPLADYSEHFSRIPKGTHEIVVVIGGLWLYSVLAILAWNCLLFLFRFVRKTRYFSRLTKLFPDEKAELNIFDEHLSVKSETVTMDVPLKSIFAIRNSSEGVTLGVGQFITLVPRSAFASTDDLRQFLLILKQGMTAAAIVRSSDAFHGVVA